MAKNIIKINRFVSKEVNLDELTSFELCGLLHEIYHVDTSIGRIYGANYRDIITDGGLDKVKILFQGRDEPGVELSQSKPIREWYMKRIAEEAKQDTEEVVDESDGNEPDNDRSESSNDN